jgi:hypothetical protein
LGRYEEAEADWAGQRQGVPRPRKPEPDEGLYVTSGPTFVRQLYILLKVTQDPRFGRALGALLDNGLIREDLEWTCDWLPAGPRKLAEDIEEAKAWLIEAYVRRGESERVACAIVAAHVNEDGASFEAVVKKLSRSWRKHKAEGRLEGPYPTERLDTLGEGHVL